VPPNDRVDEHQPKSGAVAGSPEPLERTEQPVALRDAQPDPAIGDGAGDPIPFARNRAGNRAARRAVFDGIAD
jgi:hypothetical protein